MSGILQPVKRGRRPLTIDLDSVERCAAIGCTIEEIAALIGMSPRSFYDHLEANPDLRETIDRARESGKRTLRRMQWQGAESGNATMLIWLGKQLLDQKDRASTEITGKISLEHLVLQAAGLITDEKKD